MLTFKKKIDAKAQKQINFIAIEVVESSYQLTKWIILWYI